MSKRLPLPYHCIEALDNASADLDEAYSLAHRRLRECGIGLQEEAVLSRVGMLVSEARLWLGKIERGKEDNYVRPNGRVGTTDGRPG